MLSPQWLYAKPTDIKPVVVTQQESFEGSGVQAPYFSMVRRGCSRENFMPPMYFYHVWMDLSSNNFSGRVPSSVGDLQHLLTLNLSKNHLNGPMPAEFGNIRSIQILILIITVFKRKFHLNLLYYF
ncbi:hypothetical protein C5167_044831 [Papaver somniferum]|nr:hypothetical protein C5167_044831 [Papaver somniferum]